MKFRKLIVSIIFFIFGSYHNVNCQINNANNCTSFFRSVRRAGLNMGGRLEIPVDEQFPKFQLRLTFSRPIHHLTVKQLKARDVGSHREFVLDPMEQQNDGIMRLDTFVRLRHMFGPIPRVNRIVYNGHSLCGAPLDPSEIDGSQVVSLSTTTTARTVTVITVPTTQKTNKIQDYEEEEQIFE